MLVGAARWRPRPRGVRCSKPALEQVGLVDVLDRVRLLADRDGERREPDRAAAELASQMASSSSRSRRSRPTCVDLEQLERRVGDRGVDRRPSPRTSA